MPKYVLHYFCLNARGEAARMLFKLAGVEFEDRKIAFTDWETVKKEYTLEQVPVLEVDGVQIGQSKAIVRYLAKEFGFHGSTNLEGALLDEIIDTCEDGWAPINSILWSHGEPRKIMVKKLKEETLPALCTRLDAMYALDRAGDFFLGNSLTSADLFFYTLVETIDFYNKLDCLEMFPKLTALKNRIISHPIIAKWIAERPEVLPHPLMQDDILD